MTTPLRIAVGGIYHETNTFAADLTTREGFHAYQYASGPGLLGMQSTRSEMGGFLDGLASCDNIAVPTTYAAAVPSGTVDHDAYVSLRNQILEQIAAAPNLDGVLLTLHGAMVTDGCDDPDGDLVQAVRALIGGHVPIVTTVDLHANVSDAMTTGVEASIAYDTYPHIDMYERGAEAATILDQVIRSGTRRHVRHLKLPLLTAPAMQATAGTPMRDLFAMAHRLEAEGQVQISLTPGFAYADVDSAGFSITASGVDAAAVDQAAAEMHTDVLGVETLFRYEAPDVATACNEARSAARTPVILVDAADNIGGGAPGDGTAILSEWLSQGGTGLVTTIADERSAATAIASGVGADVSLRLGAHVDRMHGDPIECTARVIRITDGKYTHTGSYNRGYQVSMGPTAVVDIAGNTVVISTTKAMPFDAEQLRSQGVDPAAVRAIVVKSAIAWRAAYGDVAAHVIEADTPGICSSNLTRFDWSPARAAMVPSSQR